MSKESPFIVSGRVPCHRVTQVLRIYEMFTSLPFMSCFTVHVTQFWSHHEMAAILFVPLSHPSPSFSHPPPLTHLLIADIHLCISPVITLSLQCFSFLFILSLFSNSFLTFSFFYFYLLACSLTSISRALIHLFVHLLAHSRAHYFTHTFTRSLYSLTHSVTHSLVHLLAQPLIHSPTHPLTHSFYLYLCSSLSHSLFPFLVMYSLIHRVFEYLLYLSLYFYFLHTVFNTS